MSQLPLLGAAGAAFLQVGEASSRVVCGWRISCLRKPNGVFDVRAVFERDTEGVNPIGGTFHDASKADREVERLTGFITNPSDEQFWPSRFWKRV